MSLTLVTLWVVLGADAPPAAELPVWVGEVLRGTTVCGKPEPGTAALVDALKKAKLPDASTPAGVTALSRALAAHFDQKRVARPLTGGCAPATPAAALDPAVLGRIATKNAAALDALEKVLARLVKLGESGDELGRWGWALAQARGVQTAKGKALLKLGHKHFWAHTSKNTGADEDPSWLAMAQTMGIGLERFDKLGVILDSCVQGIDISSQPASFSPEEKEMIKNVISFSNACARSIEPRPFKEEWVRFFEGKSPKPVLAAIATLRACRARQEKESSTFNPTEAEARAAAGARAAMLKQLKVLYPRLRPRTIAGTSC